MPTVGGGSLSVGGSNQFGYCALWRMVKLVITNPDLSPSVPTVTPYRLLLLHWAVWTMGMALGKEDLVL